MKVGEKAWFFVGSKSNPHTKVLCKGECIANINGKFAIKYNGKIYRRPLSAIARVTGKEKFDF